MSAGSWVVVLEVVDDGPSGPAGAGQELAEVERLLGYLADGDPAVLIGPGRWALQLRLVAEGPAEAVRRATAIWRDAVDRLGTVGGELVRAEVVTGAEHERDCATRPARAPTLTRDEAALLDMAFRDPLTHLASPAILVDVLERALRDGPAPGTFHAVLLVDVDDLEAVNAVGRDQGDRVLRAAAAALVGAVRSADLVGRLDGDQFAVVLRNSTTATARAVADRCVAAARTASAPGLPVTVSAGVAVGFAHQTAERLLAEAAAAARAAHRAGGDRSVLFRAATIA